MLVFTLLTPLSTNESVIKFLFFLLCIVIEIVLRLSHWQFPAQGHNGSSANFASNIQGI